MQTLCRVALALGLAAAAQAQVSSIAYKSCPVGATASGSARTTDATLMAVMKSCS